jgi:hypothetical protein
MDRIRKIERQIEELEKKLSSGRFDGLLDRGSRKRDEDRLRKLQKELEKLKKESKRKK